MEEKRKVSRIKVNAVVSYRIKNIRLAGGTRVQDISELGICIPTTQFIPVDSILELEIRSDDLKEPIKTLAKVTRVVHRSGGKYQFEVGLEFVDFPRVRLNELCDFIKISLAQVNQDVSWFD